MFGGMYADEKAHPAVEESAKPFPHDSFWFVAKDSASAQEFLISVTHASRKVEAARLAFERAGNAQIRPRRKSRGLVLEPAEL